MNRIDKYDRPVAVAAVTLIVVVICIITTCISKIIAFSNQDVAIHAARDKHMEALQRAVSE